MAPVLSTSLAPELPLTKPLLRGWLHLVAFGVSLVASVVLVSLVPSHRSAQAAAAYSATVVILFGVSALYHRPQWAPRPRQWLRRLDHSAIFLLIAGTYTPFARELPGNVGTLLLFIVWGGALLGVFRAIFWVKAPKPFIACTYLLLGWTAVWYLPDLYRAFGPSVMGWLGAGGALYSIGAVFYALRRPDPWPRVFGYHELFHALVIAAAACHFVAVSAVLVRAT